MTDTFALTAASVAIATKQLSLDELVKLNMCVQVNWGDPRDLPFYDKVRGLFTENSGSEMHNDVKEALARVVLYRLDQ